MLKITRSPAFTPAVIQECGSPKLTASPKLATASIKRGFKKNTSAAFLCKKFGIEKPTPNSEEENSPATPEPNGGLSLKASLWARNKGSGETQIHGADQGNDCIINTRGESLETNDEESKLPQKCFRVMVIGSRNMGKRSFVNSLFSPEAYSPSCYKQSFDLITKTATDGGFTKRYNFYLKEQDDAQKDYKSILNVYYQACSVIFFIYNPNREDAMTLLDKELGSLKDTIRSDRTKQNKQSIVLIANNTGEESGTSFCSEEFENLKEKFDIKLNFELTNVSYFKQTILNAIEKLNECNF